MSAQLPLLCPNCGGPLDYHKDWFAQWFHWCHACEWDNRRTYEEWLVWLKEAFAAGEFDHDPVERAYVAEMLYCLESDDC